MKAIDNSALINPTTGIGTNPVNLALVAPSATWVYDPAGKTVTVTGASTITGPDTFKNMNVEVVDNQGKTVYGAVTTRTGNTGALDVSGLALTGPLTIKVTQVSTLGVISDGESNYVNASNASGAIGYWLANYTTA